MNKSLYDTFANRWYQGGSIWFYSDPHFGDDEMKRVRKNYISDEKQIKRINAKVGKNDTIIFLGDIGDINCIKRIRGYKVLIMGNHDAGATNYQRIDKVISMTDNEAEQAELRGFKTYKVDTNLYEIDNFLFDEVYEGVLMIGPRIILSHEPIDVPFAVNIHGHDHSGVSRNDALHINMCAEHINYTPVNLTALIKAGAFKAAEDIHRMTIDGAIERKAKRNK